MGRRGVRVTRKRMEDAMMYDPLIGVTVLDIAYVAWSILIPALAMIGAAGFAFTFTVQRRIYG